MPSIQLYDKLLQFPLFFGMSHNDLMQVISHTKFEFIKYIKGEHIVQEGDQCSHMIFITNGSFDIETFSDDRTYSVVESILAPYSIQPYCIFGLYQRFAATVVAATDTNAFLIDKNEIIKLCSNFEIFRINMFNLLSTQSQKLLHQPWRKCPTTLSERIVRFFSSHCLYPAGHKTIKIKMTKLSEEVNDSRYNVSIALNNMKSNGMISLSRGRIDIPSLEKLLTER